MFEGVSVSQACIKKTRVGLGLHITLNSEWLGMSTSATKYSTKTLKYTVKVMHGVYMMS